MDILNKKQKIILIIIILLILLFIGSYIIIKANSLKYISLETIEGNKEVIEETSEIVVHIIGAIKKEGIIKTKEGSRISDIIELAGGITEEADLSKINLAYIVQDGQKIYVPNINDKENVVSITEDVGQDIIKDGGNSNMKEKININTATQTQLETLSGIGPSTALKIINYREQNGKFKEIEDIKNVPGIGDAKFENIKEEISVK